MNTTLIHRLRSNLAPLALCMTLALMLAPAAQAQNLANDGPSYANAEPMGIALEGWKYPYPVQMLQFELEGRIVRMAYMDVKPENPNGQSLLLLHGKNFGSDYWAQTLKTMSLYGYRVIAPDQIGFGKSSKPEIAYSFAGLADNTARLLDHLKVKRVSVVGNSMGGMLAVHFARKFPERVSALVLENPLGLEDYSVIPAQQTPNLVRLEMAQTPSTYRNFVKGYFQNWKPEYERYIEPFARTQLSADYPTLATVSALTYQMIYEGPILKELPQLKVPTLLVIGQSDRTVFGRRFAPPDIVKPMGNFPAMGRAAQQAIPGALLKEFRGVGHIPHLEQPERFHAVLVDFIYGRN